MIGFREECGTRVRGSSAETYWGRARSGDPSGVQWWVIVTGDIVAVVPSATGHFFGILEVAADVPARDISSFKRW